jgi:peroxiredoxin
MKLNLLAAVCALAAPGCATAKHDPGASAQNKELKLVLPNVPGPGDSNLGALKGKVVLVDFWATWCGPCHDAARAYEKLYQRFHADGLEVYGVSIDEDASQIPAFVREQGISYPIVLDQGGDVAQGKFDLSMVPSVMLVDRAGRIRFMHAGFDDAELSRTTSEVQQLLAESPSGEAARPSPVR